MKAIINARSYNTDTATVITQASNGPSYRDYRWVCETLFRKRNGEFFLLGEGGPLSKYAEKNLECTMYGAKIIPMTDDEARRWAEQHCTAEAFEAIFGPVSE